MWLNNTLLKKYYGRSNIIRILNIIRSIYGFVCPSLLISAFQIIYLTEPY